MLEVTFDGHRLNDSFLVCDVYRPLMAPEATTKDVPGRDGAAFIGSRRAAFEVSVTLAALRDSERDMRAAMRQLASWLAVDRPKRLDFSDESPLWYSAVPSACGDLETLGLVNGRVEVTFIVPDACIYGDEHSTTSSGGTLPLVVGGTLPALLRIESAAASGDFAVRDESGRECRVSVGASAKALVIDSSERVCTVGGSAAMLSLTSDWPKLAPGAHELTRASGAGEFTAKYTERWC